jgi:hydroxyacylglutathione hydrolase
MMSQKLHIGKSMSVHQLYTESPLENFNYFIELNETDVAVVDPLFPDQVLEWCQDNQKTLKVAIISHDHHDHVAGMMELKSHHGIELWAHESICEDYPIDRRLVDGDNFEIQGGECEVLFTPGHQYNHICLLGKDDKGKHDWLITMDTVFNAGVGNCKNGGDPAVLYESIKRIGEYVDDGAMIYPGHDYIENNLKFTLDREPDNESAKKLLKLATQVGGRNVETDLGKEKEVNVFFRLDSKTIRENIDEDVESDKDVFIALRKLRNNW